MSLIDHVDYSIPAKKPKVFRILENRTGSYKSQLRKKWPFIDKYYWVDVYWIGKSGEFRLWESKYFDNNNMLYFDNIFNLLVLIGKYRQKRDKKYQEKIESKKRTNSKWDTRETIIV